MTTTTSQHKQQQLGSLSLMSTNTHDKVHDKVKSWNWNANVFEIYDEIRDWHEQDIKNVLTYAYYYFNQDQMINELHNFLTGWGVEES